MNEIVLVRDLRVCGSPYAWRVAMRENKNVSTSAGLIKGILIRRAICHSLAPSICAASWISPGIERSAVYITIMLKPTPPQIAMLASEPNKPGNRES